MILYPTLTFAVNDGRISTEPPTWRAYRAGVKNWAAVLLDEHRAVERLWLDRASPSPPFYYHLRPEVAPGAVLEFGSRANNDVSRRFYGVVLGATTTQLVLENHGPNMGEALLAAKAELGLSRVSRRRDDLLAAVAVTEARLKRLTQAVRRMDDLGLRAADAVLRMSSEAETVEDTLKVFGAGGEGDDGG